MNRNIPYIKEYNAEGEVTNLITDRYISVLPNRAARRQKEGRFHGNGNNYHLSVTPNQKFRRMTQIIWLKDGTRKRILHYV